MSWVLDLIIAVLILLEIFASAKRGFVRIVIETVGFILALFITFTIHTPLANMTYDKMVAPAIEKAISDAASGSTDEITSGIWENLPSYIKDNAVFPAISEQALSEAVTNSVSAGKDTAKTISESLIRPTAVQVLSLIYSVVLMAVFMIVVRIAARAINRVFSFSLAGRINTVLGALTGIVRGIVSAVIFCLVLSLIVSFTKNGIWIFTREALENSWFMQLLAQFEITRITL